MIWFHVDHAEMVFAIIQPRRRRQLSADHRAKLVTAGAAALQNYRQLNSERTKTGQIPTIGTAE